MQTPSAPCHCARAIVNYYISARRPKSLVRRTRNLNSMAWIRICQNPKCGAEFANVHGRDRQFCTDKCYRRFWDLIYYNKNTVKLRERARLWAKSHRVLKPPRVRHITTAESKRRYVQKHPERIAASSKRFRKANPQVYALATRKQYRNDANGYRTRILLASKLKVRLADIPPVNSQEFLEAFNACEDIQSLKRLTKELSK